MTRLPSSILSFVLAFVAGVGVIYLDRYITEWRTPAFTKDEAVAMLGHRVRNISWSPNHRAMKCPNGGLCADVKVGDRGSVVAIQQSSGGYFLVVRWDEPSHGEPMLSYFGRMTRRVFLKVE
jgi:hypothetical protein